MTDSLESDLSFLRNSAQGTIHDSRLISNTKLQRIQKYLEELQQWRKAFEEVSTFRSDIPLINIGRQNALNDLENKITRTK